MAGTLWYMLAGIHENRFAALISHCGLFDMKSWYLSTEEMFFANKDLGGPFWQDNEPLSYSKHNPINYVQHWTSPLLVIHGANDFRVPVNQGMEAFQAAQLRGIPSRFLYFPEEGHWVQSPQNGLVWHDESFWLVENSGSKTDSSLLKRPPFTQGTLPNGLRWIHQQVASPAGHVGLVIQAGSRDESDPKDEGLAHFIEHMMFKGTTKRKAFHVLSRVESVGGELNAYTSKEDTSIYASFLKNPLQQGDGIVDGCDPKTPHTQTRKFPKSKMSSSTRSMPTRINQLRCSSMGLINCSSLTMPWDGISLEQSRQSSPSTERTFMRFTQAFYHPERAVLSSVGGISPERFERLAMKFASDWTANSKAPVRLLHLLYRSPTEPRSVPSARAM